MKTTSFVQIAGKLVPATLYIYEEIKMSETLRSWNESSTKQKILDYVAGVTDEASPTFVPVPERVATFDNDGTLWCEKPAYIQLLFAIDRLKQMSEADPKLLEKPAYRAAAEGEMAYFAGLYPGNIPALMQIVFETHGGMAQAEFETLAGDFLSEAKHPRFGVPFKQLVYKPMVELLHYLADNGFKVFIASAGGMSFVRTVAEEIYGVPRERVIGSNVTFETKMTAEGPVLMRKAGLVDPVDDGPGKPVNIELHVGRRPILAGGNANGDLHMLWYSETSDRSTLQLLVHHDDAQREYAYDAGAEQVLSLAAERDWLIISMKDDWREIF